MERKVGTVSRGIRCPIIREGDDLVKIVTESVLEAAKAEGFEIRDRDVIAVTESVVARSQGNYASVEAIAEDVRQKLGGETIGVIFPILSRNSFACSNCHLSRNQPRQSASCSQCVPVATMAPRARRKHHSLAQQASPLSVPRRDAS